MSIGELVVDKYWVRAVFVLQALLHVGDFVVRDFETRPSVPLEASGLAEAAKAGDQAAGGHGECVAAVIGALDGDGETVREEEEPAVDFWRKAICDTGVCSHCWLFEDSGALCGAYCVDYGLLEELWGWFPTIRTPEAILWNGWRAEI